MANEEQPEPDWIDEIVDDLCDTLGRWRINDDDRRLVVREFRRRINRQLSDDRGYQGERLPPKRKGKR